MQSSAARTSDNTASSSSSSSISSSEGSGSISASEGSGSSSSGSSTTSGASSVVHHFRQNFELSGFGSPGEALVQTVKELVDNAIDACRGRTSEQDAPTVRVVLRRPSQAARDGSEPEDLGEGEGPLELQVADNGAGLTDVTDALALFSSTKSGHGLATESSAGENAGKYGLGLTLSLLYSQKHFGGSLKVTTALLGSTEWSFTKCNIDLVTGQPRTVYRKSGLKPDSWAQGCGTDMRLLVPGGEGALHYAKPRLQALFARMHLLPDRAAGVSLKCEACCDNLNISVPRGGREASPHLLVDNQDLVRAFARGLAAMVGTNHGTLCAHTGESSSIYAEEGQQAESQTTAYPSRTGSTRGSTASPLQYFPSEDVAVFECQGVHGTWVTAAVAVERPQRSRKNNESTCAQPLSVDTTAPLFVHRFANGVPMLDTNTSSACALVAGVAKAGWRALGLKLSASRVLPSEGKLRFTISEAPTTLKVKGGAAWSALADIKAVHVSVAANSNAIPYSSLRKDAIAHREGYVPATANAVRNGLVSLSSRESGGFRSAMEAAKEMMHEDLVPLVASSIASMVSRSGDVSFQKNCLHALGVGNEYVQLKRLSDFVQGGLLDNIREEEERRATAKARAAARRAEEAKENQEGPQPEEES